MSPPPSRPHIICHMATSLDGRLRVERWPCSDMEVLATYEELSVRFDADGWIVGRKTMEHHVASGEPNIAPGPKHRADHVASGVSGQIAVCFDRQGRLRPETGEIDGDHLVLVLSDRASDDHVDFLVARGVSVFFAGPEGNDIGDALVRVRSAFGTERLLLEGGGVINGAFLEADLIDETSTLVFPVVDAEQGSPSIYENTRKGRARQLELLSAHTLDGGIVWLRHRVVRG
ncbi:dihydrofolate reductase family protein [Roseibium suaedae]|uniref:Pyrimidine reductase, riboflavin biosynthesis n=1 Tax=Roseibium suaedae TaxID=735517 RepID=A0A1M7KKF9_9HYPH|nr:dihydrofolate reductase family protein [Roseibium suaedae]SHM65848.1 Pyrimidine reductase, riboflavin biosynthesis [Roseibium suaedae]